MRSSRRNTGTNVDGVPPTPAAVGLDAAIRACLFDLDGVLTRTATLHAEAWKTIFDAFLSAFDARTGRLNPPFDQVKDCEAYVDGKTRDEGIRSFLASRDIKLPEGVPDFAHGTETVQGIGAAKQTAFLSLLEVHGPRVYEGSVRFVRAARSAGLVCAVVTSSANCESVLRAAGIAQLFDATVDGDDMINRGLIGKPAPDSYLAAAAALDVTPEQTAVFEDVLAGVVAGRAGGFGMVVGVDRAGDGQGERLREHGADVVVGDLGELLPAHR
jgi:beta-phosphoglucomutase family hydrolase